MRRPIRAVRGSLVAALVLVGALAGGLASAGRAALDVQGHRGWRGHYPENTMAAFRAALDLRVTTLEFDVQVTRDGVAVVHHDPQLDRSRCVRDDGRPVERLRLSQMDLAELDDIDCGSHTSKKFPEQRAVPGERIPRLDEVLDLAQRADYPVRVSIEIKMQDAKSDRTAKELAGIVVEAVRAHGLEERAAIQSFQAEALDAVAELAPELLRAILVRSPGGYDRAVEASRATILSPRHDGLTRAAVERFQQRGIAVVPWTVNKPSIMERMISWGVDGIISDYPDRVLRILDPPSGDAP